MLRAKFAPRSQASLVRCLLHKLCWQTENPVLADTQTVIVSVSFMTGRFPSCWVLTAGWKMLHFASLRPTLLMIHFLQPQRRSI